MILELPLAKLYTSLSLLNFGFMGWLSFREYLFNLFQRRMYPCIAALFEFLR
jgi:hypothetical protein